MTQDYLKYKEEITEYLSTKRGFIYVPGVEYANFKYAPGTILIGPSKSKYEIIGLIKYTTGYVRYLGILTNSVYGSKVTSRDWKDLHDTSSQYRISLNDMLKEL